MIRPEKNRIACKLLDLYIDRKVKNSFSFVNYHWPHSIDLSSPLLVISNHTSWWDGFFIWQLNKKHLKKSFHVMMLEEQVKQYPFFSKVGAFSVKPGTRSIKESLDFTIDLLSDHRNSVLYFPQGKLCSVYDDDLQFMGGVNYVLDKVKNINVVFTAILFDYGSNPKPFVNVVAELVSKETIDSASVLNRQYMMFYERAKAIHLKTFKG